MFFCRSFSTKLLKLPKLCKLFSMNNARKRKIMSRSNQLIKFLKNNGNGWNFSNNFSKIFISFNEMFKFLIMNSIENRKIINII